MQTDPIFYADQMNMYAYVGNDPVNKVDPTGECQVDANGNKVGICGTTDATKSLVNGALNDKNSHAGDIEKIAVGQGVKIDVKEGQYKDGIDGGEISGATTQTNETTGETYITFDLTERVVLGGHNEATGDSEKYTAPDNEVLEHELDHVKDRLTGTTHSGDIYKREAPAIEAENRYREKTGNPFRRDYVNLRGVTPR